MTSLAQSAPAPEAPQALLDEATAEIAKVVVGHRGPIELLLTAAVAGGHVLLEGPPGVAKTLLAGSLARALGVQFSRIQLTPDTRPSELTGESVVKFGERTFAPGAVFTNVLLADEINRAQPRAQAALLEAMQEHHVTIDGRSHWLPVPFVVIATQNPFEHEGVFRLPASQLDRFLFRVAIDYPTEADELEMLAIPHRGVTPDMLEDIRPLLDVGRLLRLQGLVDGVVVPEDVSRYLVAIVRKTRELPDVTLGASPRATVHLQAAVRASAVLAGRRSAEPEDVVRMAPHVLAHRVISESLGGAEVIAAALDAVPRPSAQDR